MKTINRLSVKSSYIDSIGYEGDTLEVTFKGGKTFRYVGVPLGIIESVIGAESVGKALQENILKGGFEGEKVEEDW